MKSKHRINKEDIRRIVQETLTAYLDTKDAQQRNSGRIEGPIPDLTNYFNSLLLTNKDYGKRNLEENLINTYDINTVKKMFCWKFGIDPQQFVVIDKPYNGMTLTCRIVLDKGVDNNTIGEMKHFMDTCGYFEFYEPQDEDGFRILFFEPQFSKDITEKK